MRRAVFTVACVLLAQFGAIGQAPQPIRGRVVDAETGVPIRGARLIRSTGGVERPNPPLARTDADGRFEIPAGTPAVVLAVVKAGYAWQPLPRDARGTLEVRLVRGVSVTVVVVDQSGMRVPGRSLRISCRLSANATSSATFAADDFGEARLPYMPADGCQISLAPPELLPAPRGAGPLTPDQMRAYNDAMRERVIRQAALTKAMPATPIALRPGEDAAIALLDSPLFLPADARRPETWSVIRPFAGPAGSASIRGRIMDPAGRPADGARIAMGGGGSEMLVVTGETGEYALTGLPAGRYRLQAALEPYGVRSFGQQRSDGSSAREVVLADGQQVEQVDMQFESRRFITGVVFDEYGEPADGAIVTATPMDMVGMVRPTVGGFPLTVASREVAGERGVYRIFALPGVYRVSATFGNDTTYHHPGNTSMTEALPVDVRTVPGLSGVDIVMGRALRVPLRGTVMESNGAPATGGTVRLAGEEPGGAPYPPLMAAIDSDGRFSFAGVAPGEYTLSAATRPLPYVIVRHVNGQLVDPTPVPAAEYGEATVTVGVGTPSDVAIRTAPRSAETGGR